MSNFVYSGILAKRKRPTVCDTRSAKQEPQERHWKARASAAAFALAVNGRQKPSPGYGLPLFLVQPRAAVLLAYTQDRSAMRLILFVPVFGNASTNRTSTGRLYFTISTLQYSKNSSGVMLSP